MSTHTARIRRGAFVTFEGPEGSGKSTQIRLLADRLAARGIETTVTREPGGTRTGELIREILQHDKADEPIFPECETLLFMASRAQLVRQVILPALERGVWVLSDRFLDSTTAYQGYGRQFGPARIEVLNAMAVGPAMPDLTLLLDLDVKTGLTRMTARNHAAGCGHDRLEREDVAFHERVRDGYLELARRMPDRIRVIDAGQDEALVAQAIWATVGEQLGQGWT